MRLVRIPPGRTKSRLELYRRVLVQRLSISARRRPRAYVPNELLERPPLHHLEVRHLDLVEGHADRPVPLIDEVALRRPVATNHFSAKVPARRVHFRMIDRSAAIAPDGNETRRA